MPDDEHTPRSELYKEWQDFHRENPRIYQMICHYSQQVIDAGHDHYAIATIWERMRWHFHVETKDKDFKLPNNHRAYYARFWLAQHPDREGFFHIATLRSLNPRKKRDRYGRDDDEEC
jgi:hypothetical protein